MSDDDLHKTRINAVKLLDDPHKAIEAERVISAIALELEHRHLPGMIATFREKYPGGFYGEKQAVEERDYKVAAKQLCLELLAQDEFAQLLEEKNWGELQNRVKHVVTSTNLIQGSFEKPKLLEAINKIGNTQKFFSGLFNVLWGKADFYERFQRFCDMLSDLGLNKWTYATYFVFLVDQEHGMFVKPTVLKKSLEKSHYPLVYESTPSADLYRQIVKFSWWLFARISELQPRDLIDVQSFMWHMAPTGKWADD